MRRAAAQDRYLTDVGRSLAHHGFRRMLFLNGHGSNQNLVETAARLMMVERPEMLAAAVAECVAYVDELLAKPLPARRERKPRS